MNCSVDVHNVNWKKLSKNGAKVLKCLLNVLPGSHREGVQVAAVAVPHGLAVAHDGRPAQHPRVVVDVRHRVGEVEVLGPAG